MAAVFAIITDRNTGREDIASADTILAKGLMNYGRGGLSEPRPGERTVSFRNARIVLGSVQNDAHVGVPPTPCIIETDRHVAVCDAMIYNRRSFPGQEKLSDGELLVKVYEKEGLPGLRSLSADFAAVLIDKSSGEVLLLRDHMGIRPLYLLRAKGYMAVSTDYRPFFELPGNGITINEENLYEHLTMGIIASLTETLFANIAKAEAGCVTRVDTASGEGEASRYWSPGQRHVPARRRLGKRIRSSYDRKCMAVYAKLVRQAVTDRAEAVGLAAIGAEFSGGLDSGIVVSVLDEYAKGNGCELPTLATWSPSTKEYPIREKRDEVIRDERQVIERFCAEKGNTCIYRPGRNSGDVQKYMEALERQDICEYDADIITYTTEALGEKGVKTVFSGWGGDEAATMRFGPAQLLDAGEYAAFIHEAAFASKGRPRKFLGFVKRALYARKESRIPWDGVAVNGWDFSIVKEDYAKRIQGGRGKKLNYFGWNPKLNLLSGGMESRTLIAESTGADAGMAYMFPLLDPLLIDFAITVPRRLFMRDGIGRYLPQKAFSDIVPAYLTNFSGESNVEKLDTGRMDFFYEVAEKTQRKTDRLILSKLDRDLFDPYVDFEKLEQKLLSSEEPPERNVLRKMARTLYKMQILLEKNPDCKVE
ncbi:MAG: asparagine synthase-related protein [Lachnospiraceae bacterium]|nr:asparagine synthase-related protein [Lachnospiraceae bacterium]